MKWQNQNSKTILSESKTGFLVRLPNLATFPPDQSGKNGEMAQIINIRNERNGITTDFIRNQIHNKVYSELYANKVNDQMKKKKVLKSHKLPKSTQKEIHNLKSPTSIKEIDVVNTLVVVNNLSTKTTLSLNVFWGTAIDFLRKNNTNSSKMLQEREYFPTHILRLALH